MSSPLQAYSLPGKLYLLGIDIDKERVPDRRKLAYVVRAAALIELGLRGNVADVDGKVQVTNDEGIGDPVLNLVLGEIAMGRDRKWKHWVRYNDRDTLNSVENQLMSAGAITVHERMILADRVHALDPPAIGQLRQRILTTLTGDQQIGTLDPYDVALTALAANGELRTAISSRERRAHKDRITALTRHIGTSAPALRSLVSELRSRRSTGWIGAANAGQ
jgi:hypothetical protein